MDIRNTKYEVTAVKPEQYPVHDLPEIALVGRSNVGKSSFINTMVQQKNLARSSATPGKTREINFYNIDRTFYFVDLPGYGYAKVSKEKKETWDEMIETYLSSRAQLQAIIMLVDIRHAPSAEDRVMAHWLRSRGLPSITVAAKLDKISRSQINKRVQEIRTVLTMDESAPLIPFSAETRQGRDEVWRYIQGMI